MMNYEIFKEVVADTFRDYLPEQYRNMELKVMPVNKVNRMMDGINLIGGKDDRVVSPTIYINDMYDHYKACNDLKDAIQTGAERMVNAFRKCPETPKIDLADAKDNIVLQLVNTEQNKEMLAGVPHRDFQDLSIIYRWVIKMDDDGIQSTLIQNSLAEQLGVNEEQLFKMAAENTRRIFPPRIRSMNEVICEMFMKDGMPQEIAEMMIGEVPADKSMWVISNDRGVNGAVSMLYEDKLHTLATEMESDLYILPSSVHEVIAISASMGDPNELAEMVAEINMVRRPHHHRHLKRKNSIQFLNFLDFSRFSIHSGWQGTLFYPCCACVGIDSKLTMLLSNPSHVFDNTPPASDIRLLHGSVYGYKISIYIQILPLSLPPGYGSAVHSATPA